MMLSENFRDEWWIVAQWSHRTEGSDTMMISPFSYRRFDGRAENLAQYNKQVNNHKQRYFSF